MATGTKAAVAIGAFPTNNGLIPCEGCKTIPFTFDFNAFLAYLVDLTLQQDQKKISVIQSVYIDNSLNLTNTLSIDVDTTGQHLVFPQKSCGYVPLLVPTPSKLTFSSAGAVVVGVQLLNFYIPPTVWGV